MFKFEVGQSVQININGLKGIHGNICTRTENVSGSMLYSITYLNKEGLAIDTEWVRERDIENHPYSYEENVESTKIKPIVE